MGRPPKGLDHIESLGGDAESKRRLRTLLETLTGERTVESACRQLQISEARFHVLRREMLDGALDALKPGRVGRPAKPEETAEARRVRELERELLAARIDLEAERVRTEIALVMPHVLVDGKKKQPQRLPQERRRRGRDGGTSDA